MLVRTKLAWCAMAAAMAMVLVGVAGVSAADPMVFDRGLPTANLNNAAGASRSNVAWSNGNTFVSGDDFTIGSTGETWIVTGVRTWAVSSGAPSSSFRLGDEYSSVSLYTGTSGVAQVATGTLGLGSDTNSNANITHMKVTYPSGGPDYQGTSGPMHQIYQNDFTNLNLTIAGGVKYYFGVDGTPRSPTDYWFNHASNAALSGSAQQGADDRWLVWPKSGLANPPVACNSNGPIAGVCDGGWDKSSDINVQVFAHKFVPPAPALAVGGTTDLETGGAQTAGHLASQSDSSPMVPDALVPLGLVGVAALGISGWYVQRRRARKAR